MHQHDLDPYCHLHNLQFDNQGGERRIQIVIGLTLAIAAVPMGAGSAMMAPPD